MSKYTIAYIAGPYRAPTYKKRQKNIDHAEHIAKKAWKAGFDFVICPHLNTKNFDGIMPDLSFLQGDLLILEFCTHVIMLKDWMKSEGAKVEHKKATDLGLTIIGEEELEKGFRC